MKQLEFTFKECPDCLWHKNGGYCIKKKIWLDEEGNSCLDWEEL